MVQIVKDGNTLLVPKPAYEADYKKHGWKIVGQKQQVEKQVASLTINEEKVNDSKKNKNK